MIDTVALSRLWDERWPGGPKLPYELRGIWGSTIGRTSVSVFPVGRTLR